MCSSDLLVILVPVPLTLIGIMIGHYIFNAAFTATSMIGFIALAGIIVRNSILLVDFIRHARSGGKGLRDALLEAGHGDSDVSVLAEWFRANREPLRD